jgi:hypothetical protein
VLQFNEVHGPCKLGLGLVLGILLIRKTTPMRSLDSHLVCSARPIPLHSLNTVTERPSAGAGIGIVTQRLCQPLGSRGVHPVGSTSICLGTSACKMGALCSVRPHVELWVHLFSCGYQTPLPRIQENSLQPQESRCVVCAATVVWMSLGSGI